MKFVQNQKQKKHYEFTLIKGKQAKVGQKKHLFTLSTGQADKTKFFAHRTHSHSESSFHEIVSHNKDFGLQMYLTAFYCLVCKCHGRLSLLFKRTNVTQG